MRDPLDGVALFIEVVNAGGFSRAAEQLSLTRSAVGKGIARVEERLGVRLFHRTTRTQSLTEDGQVYYEHCMRAMEEIRTAHSLLDSGLHEIVGRMKVTMPVLFGRHCAAPILLDIARQHAGLELDLHFSDQPTDLIAEGFDLAVRFGPLGPLQGLQARRVGVQHKLLCASPKYLATSGEPQSIADLSSHDALLYYRRDYVQPWVIPDKQGQLHSLTPESRIRLNDLATIADAVEAGMGIGWLPSWLVRERLQSGHIVRVLSDCAPAQMECHIVWPDTRLLPKRLTYILEALVQRLPETLKLEGLSR
ncbi:LysR family transcriptional regulator [Pseudomonas floridensis]|uniref:LysR family transcriptional regulator n=1 Tax=Pseudomonas floridensis TaxID=1958950 RepID=A0A1X0N4G8_9PSED|nr:LysR family transcriptional regulator [Pseudomonas floridensis]ORC58422.1 LysR family transcriptional regulator [Pseudomonas floridensis]